MKKIIKFIICLALVFTLFPSIHIHNSDCGYDESTKQGCVYEVSNHDWILPPPLE